MTGIRAAALLLSTLLPLAVAAPRSAPIQARHAVVRPLHTLPAGHAALAQPPDTAACQRLLHISCYRPAQLQRAYRADSLHAIGLDGRGRTIVVVVAFGSPTVAADLRGFDAAFGLPDPPSLRVIAPAGAPPPFDGANPDMEGWAEETTLDVEAAHLMSPAASILVVTTPVSETEGLQGFPEIVSAEQYVLDHDLGDVITQSFGATEQTFPSGAAVMGLRSAFESARQHGVTMLAASGDNGATGPYLDASCCYPQPVVSWPSSDPLVTSVGGTQLHLDASGQRVAPDGVWNDPAALLRGGSPSDPITAGAAGGGRSNVFPRPDFQSGVAGVVGGARGVPDVSLSAAQDGAMIVYWSFASSFSRPGYHLIGGTSEASPLLAGLVAIADQIRGGRVGWIDPVLYRMGGGGAAGIADVTAGDNHYTFADPQGRPVTVPGYRAAPGYDLASGWGTVDAALFCPLLAQEA
jgi:subtilase family serine protease